MKHPIYTIGQVVMFINQHKKRFVGKIVIAHEEEGKWKYIIDRYQSLVLEKDIRKVIGEEKKEEKEFIKITPEDLKGEYPLDTKAISERYKNEAVCKWITQRLRDIAEIYIGMDGIGGAKTAPEAYQEMKLKEMYDEIQDLIKVITKD